MKLQRAPIALSGSNLERQVTILHRGTKLIQILFSKYPEFLDRLKKSQA